MSNYYKYKFVSPEPIFAIVKEELKSYFDTGAVDDLLFPVYVNKCLRKLDKSALPIVEQYLHVEDYQARLPDNFDSVREAWMCSSITFDYQEPHAHYSQEVINDFPAQACLGDTVSDIEFTKTTFHSQYNYRRDYLLRPGNLSAIKNCDNDYNYNLTLFGQQVADRNFTPRASDYRSFDIRDNKFVTNFRNGIVSLLFYSTEYDNNGSELVPDNYRVFEYIEAFLKYKIFETLSNQIIDETFNQIQQKVADYKQQYNEAFIMVLIEMKKETAWKKQQVIKQQTRRFNRYRYNG